MLFVPNEFQALDSVIVRFQDSCLFKLLYADLYLVIW